MEASRAKYRHGEERDVAGTQRPERNMKQEGMLTDVVPKYVDVPIRAEWKALAMAEAKRRQDRDSKSDSRWVRGINVNAHYLGLIGECAFSELIGQPVDWSPTHDAGYDFEIYGVRLDVKVTVSLELPAVRRRAREICDGYVWGKIQRGICRFEGWNTRSEFSKHGRFVELPSGINKTPVPHKLRPVQELLDAGIPANAIRYPGGKSKCWDTLAGMFPAQGMFSPDAYVDLFVGGGAMLFRALQRDSKWDIVINDKDSSLVNVYLAIRDKPRDLQRAVMAFNPSVEAWQRSKEVDGEPLPLLKSALAKLVLHYCSHAGFGFMAGGPQGGKSQQSKYQIGCRWKPARICRMIEWLSPRIRDAEICNLDFADVPIPEGAFVFADPPYWHKGNTLYRHGMDSDCHHRLKDFLCGTSAEWLVTYDDCPEIRSMYKGHLVSAFDNRTGNRPVHGSKELAITNYA